MFPYHDMVARRLDEWPVVMTAAGGPADLSRSVDSQAAAVGIGGAVGAIGTACAVRIVDGVGRKPRPVPAVGVSG